MVIFRFSWGNLTDREEERRSNALVGSVSRKRSRGLFFWRRTIREAKTRLVWRRCWQNLSVESRTNLIPWSFT